MAAGAVCSPGPRSDLQAIICCITMWLRNVCQQKAFKLTPLPLAHSAATCFTTPMHLSPHKSRSAFRFTSGLMTSCRRRFKEHPSSSQKQSRKTGMPNEADKWSLQFVVHFEGRTVARALYEGNLLGSQMLIEALWSEWRISCWWMSNCYLRELTQSQVKFSGTRENRVNLF